MAVRRPGMFAVLVMLLLVAGSGVVGVMPASGQEAETGWEVSEFLVTYRVQPDGSVEAEERLEVDFGTLERRGIFRYFVTRARCYEAGELVQKPLEPCPDGWHRRWDYDAIAVTDGSGTPLKFEETRESGILTVKIGDPDVTVTGRQVYILRYRLQGALDAYEDHDELYWNSSGTWPVPVRYFEARVVLPGEGAPRGACYVGFAGSDELCDARATAGDELVFSSRALEPGEQVTVAAGWEKGLVEVPPPLVIRPARVADYVAFDALEWTGLALTVLGGLAVVMALWWRHGRDRQYRTIYYLTEDPTEQTRPFFGGAPLVVEYTPPDDLRPVQMGVLLDERADTLDVTATVIDLAVRGYLHITEVPKEGWFGKADWELERRKDGKDLFPYERKIVDALFEKGERVRLSDLKYEFADDLVKAKRLIYDDAMAHGWFSVRPETSKRAWGMVGLGVVFAGIGLMLLAATLAGRAFAPAGVSLAGVAMMAAAPSMSRRTAKGSEALRRVLGFRLYIATAETQRQEFNEREGIFARYLPYAIVFGCVDRWARAFRTLEAEAQRSTAGWYTGVGAFEAMRFSEGLRGFSQSVSSTLASTRSSGGSGFGGGSAGGGGGGGGGGSW